MGNPRSAVIIPAGKNVDLMSLLPAPVLAQIGPGALICGLPDLKSLSSVYNVFIGSPCLNLNSILGGLDLIRTVLSQRSCISQYFLDVPDSLFQCFIIPAFIRHPTHKMKGLGQNWPASLLPPG